MLRAAFFAMIFFFISGCAGDALPNAGNRTVQHAPPVPVFYPDQPACRVKSIQRSPSKFEGFSKPPASNLWVATRYDANGVSQVYTAHGGNNDYTCITCTEHPGGPKVDRNKFMTVWHPSGQFLAVAVERDSHAYAWLPQAWQRGFMQTGVWLNMWITTPTGDRWYQMTDFKKPENGPSDGYTGPAFTPDGKKAVWAEIVDGDIFKNAFGIWKLYIADFYVSPDGAPHLVNKRDITPAGAKWVEPANISPDGRHALLSTDIGIDNAQGQDQWSLDIETGALQRLTATPRVWDEHGLYSPSGKKISFMSSYPYRDEPDAYKTFSLKTEFMLMDADGGHLQQLTHFNVPGYPESQPGRTVAAVAEFVGDGSQMYAEVMSLPEFKTDNWMITFAGRCGAE
jgi:WD40-like Beta Propeller Repeat